MIFTCIGSRSTPLEILKEMKFFGERDRYGGKHWCRSGHAEGADWAFEEGAQERMIAYIPWKGFNKQLLSRAKLVVPTFSKELEDLAREFYPRFDSLSQGAQKLMMRNGCQVLGMHLNRPADFVICWTPNGDLVGGTAQAIRIAQARHIPVVNMGLSQFNTAMKVINFIRDF